MGASQSSQAHPQLVGETAVVLDETASKIKTIVKSIGNKCITQDAEAKRIQKQIDDLTLRLQNVQGKHQTCVLELANAQKNAESYLTYKASSVSRVRSSVNGRASASARGARTNGQQASARNNQQTLGGGFSNNNQ